MPLKNSALGYTLAIGYFHIADFFDSAWSFHANSFLVDDDVVIKSTIIIGGSWILLIHKVLFLVFEFKLIGFIGLQIQMNYALLIMMYF